MLDDIDEDTEPHVHLEVVACCNCDRRAVLRDADGKPWCSRCKFGPGTAELEQREADKRALERSKLQLTLQRGRHWRSR